MKKGSKFSGCDLLLNLVVASESPVGKTKQNKTNFLVIYEKIEQKIIFDFLGSASVL